jgi:hypothetical protein
MPLHHYIQVIQQEYLTGDVQNIENFSGGLECHLSDLPIVVSIFPFIVKLKVLVRERDTLLPLANELKKELEPEAEWISHTRSL